MIQRLDTEVNELITGWGGGISEVQKGCEIRHVPGVVRDCCG